MSPETDISDVLNDVRKGDPIDHDARSRLAFIRGGTTMSVAALGVPIGIHHGDVALGNDHLLAYPGYGAAAVGTAMVANRMIRKMRMRHDEGRQEAIREALDEPVDVVRRKAGKRQTELMLRWYGLDADPETEELSVVGSELIQRSRKIIDFSKKQGINYIAVDELPFAEVGYSLESHIMSGETLLSDFKNLAFARIHDDDSAETVFYGTVADFEQLVLAYESKLSGVMLEAVVRQLNQPFIAKLYVDYHQTGSQVALKRLQSIAREAVERNTADSQYVAQRSEDGVSHLQKVHLNTALMKHGQAMQLAAGHDSLTGSDVLTVSGVAELAKLVGFPSNEELLQAVANQGAQTLTRQQLSVAFYLLLNQQQERKAVAAINANQNTAASAVQPFFGNMERGDIQHRSRSTVVYRKFGSLALAMGLVSGGMFVGSGLQTANDRLYDYDFEAYSAYAKAHGMENDRYDTENDYADSDSYKEYLDEETNSSLRMAQLFNDAMGKFYDVDAAMSDAVAKFMVERLGYDDIESIAPYYDLKANQEWQDKIAKTMPGDPYNQHSDRMGMGDASNTSNKVLFTVNSLKDEPTEGYWYNSTYDSLMLQDSDAPQSGSIIESLRTQVKTELVSYQTDPDRIKALDPDFMIETPYIGLESTDGDGTVRSIDLPVRRGMSIVAARIIDQKDDSKIFYPEIIVDELGNYHTNGNHINNGVGKNDDSDVTDYISPMVAMRMEQPVLQYWIKQDPQAANLALPRNKRYEIYDYRTEAESYDDLYIRPTASLHEIAQSVRTELGLSADASAETVIQTVQEKLYAYEPFAYEQKQLDVNELSAKDTVAEIGRVIADLKTANCNIAAMTVMLANLDRTPYTPASGFNDDGDGKLTQQESHAWLLNKDNQVVDATPSEFAPGVEPRTAIDEAPRAKKEDASDIAGLAKKGAEALLAGLILVAGYRQRKRLLQASDTVRTHATLLHPAMRMAAGSLIHDLYAKPGATATYVIDKDTPTVKAAASRYARNVSKSASITGGPVDHAERARRIVLKLNDGPIRRYVARQTSSK
jgi:hypothetical protein